MSTEQTGHERPENQTAWELSSHLDPSEVKVTDNERLATTLLQYSCSVFVVLLFNDDRYSYITASIQLPIDKSCIRLPVLHMPKYENSEPSNGQSP